MQRILVPERQVRYISALFKGMILCLDGLNEVLDEKIGRVKDVAECPSNVTKDYDE